MHLAFLLATALLASMPAAAQEPTLSPGGAGTPTAEAVLRETPESLARIRAGMRKPSPLRNLGVKADFKVHIEEQDQIDRLMSKLDVPKAGHVPAGGLYAYEQQERLFKAVDRPFQQPYAAFSGGELITISLENVFGRLLGGKAANAISGAEHTRAQAAARREVDQAIASYCDTRLDRDQLPLCTPIKDQ